MKLRQYRPDDLEQVAALFYDTIHRICIRDYSEEQVRVWAGAKERLLSRPDFFLSLYTIVATEKGAVIGYGNIDTSGYLDHLYVHSRFQRTGVASAICSCLEDHAKASRLPRITVHASITAKPFFEHRGYRMIREQQVEREGVLLTNYQMEKTLFPAADATASENQKGETLP